MLEQKIKLRCLSISRAIRTENGLTTKDNDKNLKINSADFNLILPWPETTKRRGNRKTERVIFVIRSQQKEIYAQKEKKQVDQELKEQRKKEREEKRMLKRKDQKNTKRKNKTM